MALDNANFIAELSITDPPGTDPLSQGDDHIRTVKRATQQSFPNIDKAVSITADQMNLMAIKNETNVFTAQQTIVGGDLVITKSATNTTFGVFYNDTAGFRRWALIYQPETTTGNFVLDRRDAAGASIDFPIEVDQVTGVVDFAHVPTVQGAPLWVAGEIRLRVTSAVSPGTNWFAADGTNGTVNMGNRVMIGSGADSPGTLLNPNFDGATNANPATGSTAITEAQMPAHTHSVWMSNNSSGGQFGALNTPGFDSAFGSRFNDVSRQYAPNNGVGTQLLQNAGSGSGHTHTTSIVGVDTTTTDRESVRPLSVVVTYFQYVP